MGYLPKRVAIVYDRIVKWGGAERVLLALHDLFPDAPLYTAIYSPKTASWAKVFSYVIPSLLQNLPFVIRYYQWFPWAMPLAFEAFNFNDFDLVISVTSAEAKGVITNIKTKHICCCLTPSRYLWSHYDFYTKNNLLIKLIFAYLRWWDRAASARPDKYLAISQTVAERIEKYYGRSSQVIYPGVDLQKFKPNHGPRQDYYLWVGRLVDYKNAEEVLKTVVSLNKRLIIVGSDNGYNQLRKKFSSTNIVWHTKIDDQRLIELYQHAKATVYFHEEDYGFVPLESMACGTPVIGFNKGGVTETVIEGITGVIDSDLARAIHRFEALNINPQDCIDRATNFSLDKFKKKFLLECI